jgi:hypothetical protein
VRKDPLGRGLSSISAQIYCDRAPPFEFELCWAVPVTRCRGPNLGEHFSHTLDRACACAVRAVVRAGVLDVIVVYKKLQQTQYTSSSSPSDFT